MGNGGKCAMDGGMAAQLQWTTVAVMGNGGSDGQWQAA
jgi:hypothetical protein